MKTSSALRMMFAVAVLAVAGARPASAQEAAASAVDPVGMYDFVATLGIEERTGTMQIAPDDEGHLAGEVWLEGESDPAMIENVVVTGDHVQILAYVNGMQPVTFELDFAGTGFEGTATAGDQTILLDGTRRAE